MFLNNVCCFPRFHCFYIFLYPPSMFWGQGKKIRIWAINSRPSLAVLWTANGTCQQTFSRLIVLKSYDILKINNWITLFFKMFFFRCKNLWMPTVRMGSESDGEKWRNKIKMAGKTVTNVIIVVIFTFFLHFTVCSSSRKCSFAPETGALQCSIPVLGNQNSSLDFSASSLTQASELLVECTQDENAGTGKPVFSSLNSNQFGHLPGLGKLKIHECRLRSVEPHAFSGIADIINPNSKS